MIRNIVVSLLIAAGVAWSAWALLQQAPAEGSGGHAGDTHAGEPHAGKAAKGPHGGKWFKQGELGLELVLYETGVPPEFHVYTYKNGEMLPPGAVDVSVSLTRLGGDVNRFEFTPLKDYLRGDGVVTEPHSFDVRIQARHAGEQYEWEYSTHEGRTEIPRALADEAGIETETAGPAVITETLPLTGRVQADPARVAEVRARFPGVVQDIRAEIGEQVKAGQTLARIQSNESLQTYSLKAPIDGVVLQRNLNVGAPTGDAALFVISDLSQVWVELDAFSRDVDRIEAGQKAVIETLGGRRIPGTVSYVSPVAAHASQTVQARVVLDNPERKLRPGQFVRGEVTVAEHQVPLAVRESGIQRFRDFKVVFARIGDTYEVRMLDLGRRNGEWAEVLGGLKPGTEYVTGNSYLIKADVEKSGASHAH